MMNPNINDPTWKAAREKQWQAFVAEYGKNDEFPEDSDYLTKKELSCLKLMFFEGEFDHGNKRYGKIGSTTVEYQGYRWSIRLCPIQTPERWKKYLLVDTPQWAGKYYNLKHEMEGIVSLSDSKSILGWDVETEVEAFKYICGDTFIPGEYEFEGLKVPYPLTAEHVCTSITRNLFQWLAGVDPGADAKWAHLLDTWFTALPFCEESKFVYESMDYNAYFLQSLLAMIRNYDIDRIKHERANDEDRPLIIQDTGARSRVAEYLKDAMKDSKTLPKGLRKLWKMAQKPGFIPYYDTGG